MAESAAFARRTHKGGTSSARIPGGLGAGVLGVVAGDDLSDWAGATADGPTTVTINRTSATPEVIEISDVSGNNITISARGLEGTADTDHGANATIEITSSPRDFDEANLAVVKLLGQIGGNGGKFYRVNAGGTDVEVVEVAEIIRDAVAAFLVAGANMTVTHDDGGDTLTIAAAGGAATFAGAKATRASTQSVVTATTTAIGFDGESYDSDALHDNVTNNTRLTIPAGMTGKWRFTAHVRFAANATGYRQASFRINGGASGTLGTVAEHTNSAGVDTILTPVLEESFTAGQYIEVVVVQTSGGNLDVGLNADDLWFSAQYLGA